nr:hypothetical protein [Tanacetum cinerariifolium]
MVARCFCCGVFGGSVVFSGDGVGNGVGGVVCGVDCGVCLWCGLWWCLLRRSRCGKKAKCNGYDGWLSWSHGAKGKDSFVKCDMTRNDDLVGVHVKELISTMIVRVPKKDRWCGTRGKVGLLNNFV